MRVTDSRDNSGVGILALQDHTPGESLDTRFLVAAVRKLGRDDKGGGLGHLRIDESTAGDLIGAMCWKPFTRGMPAWSFVFPSQTVGGESRTSAGGGGSAGAAGAAGANGPAGPAAPAPDGPGGSPGIGRETSGKGNLPFGPGTGAKPKVAAWIGGLPGLSGAGSNSHGDAALPTIILPTQRSTWDDDQRFTKIASPNPAGWPSFPHKWHGVTVQSTEENLQREYFHPTDPRIPLVHRGKYPACGALACDMSGTEPDLDRHARLHSMLRIVKTPPGSMRNCIGWNLTTSGAGDTVGGWIVDVGQKGGGNDDRRGPTSGTPRGEFRGPNGGVSPGLRLGQANQFGIAARAQGGGQAAGLMVAHASYRLGGPLHPGVSGDRHGLGSDGDGQTVNSLHLQTGALFVNPDKTAEDGPMLLESLFLEGKDYAFVTRVHWAFDPRRQVFRHWSTSAEDDGNTPPGDPTPPRTPEDPPPTPPPPPTTTPRDRPRDTTEPGDPNPPRQPPPPTGPGWREFSVPPNTPQGSASAVAKRVDHTRRWLEMSSAALSFRAPLWAVGAPHLTHSRGQDRAVDYDRIAPTVIRAETFAKQVTGAYGTYTQQPGSARYEGGTADGGLWFLPPEVGGEDYAADFAPTDRTTSTAYVGMGPGACLAFGMPDRATGGVRSGTSLRNEAGLLALYTHDAAGAATKNRTLVVDSSDAITADVGQSQGGSPQTAKYLRVAICANAGDSITLPAVLPGSEHFISNDGAESCNVFPASGGYINAGAINAAAAVAAGARVWLFSQTAAGKWRMVTV